MDAKINSSPRPVGIAAFQSNGVIESIRSIDYGRREEPPRKLKEGIGT